MNIPAVREPPESRDEQAAGWCMQLAENSFSPDERREFEAWMADPLNRKAFEEAAAVWQGMETAAEQPEMIHIRAQALEKLRDANSRRWARRASYRWRWHAMAAAVVLAVAAGFFLRNPTQTFATAVGERRVMVLEDGSQLSLDAATTVDVRIARDRRELHLRSGRARFDVAKDPLRPFSVMAGDKVVVAVGTSFSVELLQRQMHVVLYDGKVAVLEHPRDAAKPRPLPGVELSPGRELVASLDKPAVSVAAADISRVASWESGQLNFVNEPLDAAVERMNRYSREKLSIADATAAGFKINGVFTAGDTEAFVEGVKTFYPVELVREPGKLILRSVPTGN